MAHNALEPKEEILHVIRLIRLIYPYYCLYNLSRPVNVTFSFDVTQLRLDRLTNS